METLGRRGGGLVGLLMLMLSYFLTWHWLHWCAHFVIIHV